MSENQTRTPAHLDIRWNEKSSIVRLEAASYRVGRVPTNQVAFPDVDGMSREHMSIEYVEGHWVVRDLGSTNGSFVNGVRISEPWILHSGDRITAGRVTLVYRESAGPQPKDDLTVALNAADSTTMAESLQGIIGESSGQSGKHMEAMITAGREMAAHLSLQQLFDLILDLSIQAAGAARGLLMTFEKEIFEVRSEKGQGLRLSSHVRDLVIREKRSLLVRDAMLDSRLGAHASIVTSQIRSMMAVPLQTGGRVIGLIYLDSSQVVKEFTKQDLNLLTVMANLAAVRIENVRMAETQQGEMLRARELEQAARIQRSMLPSQFPPFPERHDFELHASMIPAKEVGGDLFDFFLLDSERIAFVLGDVSGKGVPAALFMVVVSTLMRAGALHHSSPGACLTAINESLVARHTPEMFVTLFYGILNTRTGLLEYSNAGHNPPYVFSPDGGVRPLPERCGPMLGIFEGIQYSTRSTEIRPGEGVLAFTDGVTEARNENGDFFETSRLQEYLGRSTSSGVDELIRNLMLEVERFEAGAPRGDDMTALALRRRRHSLNSP